MVAWWDHVTEIPEDRRIKVFSKGTWVALKGVIPKGGQIAPISKIGAKLLWKKAQKKEKKNNTSEVINKTIPQRSPLVTKNVWRPWKVLSRVMSRHHWYVVRLMIERLKRKSRLFEWRNHLVIPETIIKEPKEAIRGQGLWSTKWKVCLLLISIVNEVKSH